MKILVTGGAGYIGNIVTPHLLSLGFHVTVFDNLIHRQHGILENCSHPKFRFVYGDIRDRQAFYEEIKSHDAIVHLAAYVGMPLCKRFPIEAKQINQEASEFLANMVSPSQHIILTMTNSGYGLGQHVDRKAVYCTEESPLRPISIYGETKCAAENAIMVSGVNTSLRLATAMGVSRKMRLDLLVNDFVYRAWNDRFIVLFESTFLRNFVHVHDIAQAIEMAIGNTNMLGQIYNVGNTSANVNKMDLCLIIKKYLPDFYITCSEINKDPDQRNYIVSNEKLEKLGFRPAFSLEDTVKEVLNACPIIKYSNCPFSDI
jgi:nucleoside-diphosphate-sugar epimerase